MRPDKDVTYIDIHDLQEARLTCWQRIVRWWQRVSKPVPEPRLEPSEWRDLADALAEELRAEQESCRHLDGELDAIRRCVQSGFVPTMEDGAEDKWPVARLVFGLMEAYLQRHEEIPRTTLLPVLGRPEEGLVSYVEVPDPLACAVLPTTLGGQSMPVRSVARRGTKCPVCVSENIDLRRAR